MTDFGDSEAVRGKKPRKKDFPGGSGAGSEEGVGRTGSLVHVEFDQFTGLNPETWKSGPGGQEQNLSEVWGLMRSFRVVVLRV